MKKISLAKALTLFGTAALMMGTMAGCGNAATEQNSVEKHGKINLQKYEDPNGWSVTYNDADIDIATQDNMVAFVYTGPSAGTNMVMVTYDVDMDAKEAVDQLAESWGVEKTTVTESVFPGAEDVKGYWAMLQPSAEGSGYYTEAIARDYMDGYLLFDVIGHNCGDDEIDIPVSDSLAMIIDSITFNS